jgi:predicted nucleotidyltransferase component of viral defense system
VGHDMDRELAIKTAGEIKIDLEQILREWWEIIILKEILSSPMGGNLVFKGGTALRLAYGSPRFSEDLDFSMIRKISFKSFEEIISLIEKKYAELEIVDVTDKFYTYIAQYKIREPWRPLTFSVKIEVSKRLINYKEKTYELTNLKSQASNIEALGNVMTIGNIYKEKLQALDTRGESRDLFDLWYLSNILKKPFVPVKNKFDKKILVRDLSKYLPRDYWKVIDTLRK